MNEDEEEPVEEGYGEAAQIRVTLSYNGVVETAPQAEHLKEESERMLDLVKKLIDDQLEGNWSAVVAGSGPALE
jgi:hypothetical protein